ncbi:dihydroxyacetone kinase subunit DhaL [Anaeromyxobacter oryzae]|uniref:Dihydroxyacetone kinase subunit L n=1 Tax=Anaeromyxobacter oryzae TaxID=2918170 RepID=A0ABM7WPB3_9BACT|nr:dihydroxyacetone kinase subunit DhaL [Anaeromyxobacter oryzae]BDG01300.1 dihydroxyacetone kinase subunit L [Anaeromyxobacter oryzae]
MDREQLDLESARVMFLRVSDAMVASKDLLTELDRAIGDSDHGIGMARGFEAVRRELERPPFGSVGALLHCIGTALLRSMGGASGAVFGTLFRGGGARLHDERALTSAALARFLEDGLEAVQARGGARTGDKTMVDALEPAARAARARAGEPLARALPAVAEAARLGVERTRDLVARMGKARTLGERALGHVDPGAASVHLILRAMAEFVSASASEEASAGTGAGEA